MYSGEYADIAPVLHAVVLLYHIILKTDLYQLVDSSYNAVHLARGILLLQRTCVHNAPSFLALS